MKKLIVLLLAVAMLFCLVACGNDEKPNTQGSEANNNQSSVSESNDKGNKSVSLETVKKAKETDVSLFDYVEVEGGVSITDFTGTNEIVVIPQSIDGKAVVSIGRNAFVNNDTMKGVKISSQVSVLEDGCFGNCTALEVFVSGEAVKELGAFTFNGSTRLHQVELNAGLEKLGGCCFGLTNLTKIEIPSSVTEINYPFTVNNDEHYITVVAEKGSAAEQYVNEKGEEYHLIFQVK